VDFLTTPGFLSGPGAREAAGLPPGTGPIAVVSTLALMDFHPASCRMRLKGLHPGITVEEVIVNTGFELLMPEQVAMNEPPSEEELHLLRTEIDPMRFYI